MILSRMSRDSDELIGNSITNEIEAIMRRYLADNIRAGDFDNDIMVGDEDLFPEDFTEEQRAQERVGYETQHREYVVEDTDFISD